MDLIEHVVHYSSKGLSVIPTYSILEDGSCDCGNKACGAKGKHPRLNWRSQTKERMTEDELRLWWKKHPNSNIGIITGDISQVTVIDVDGEKGLKSLKAMGLTLENMPPTPTVRTGGGGYHLYYRYDKGSIKTRVNVLEKVDIRADGGLVIAPPSLHKSGNRYSWLKGKSLDDIPIADFNFSLLVKPDGVVIKKSPSWYNEALKGVGEGERNETATRLAGRCANMGMSKDEIVLYLSAWNQRNTPPMESKELESTIESIYSKENISVNQSEILEALSDILKIRVISIRRIISDSDTPSITIDFDRGVCTMSMADLLSPHKFQQEIASSTNEVIKKLSNRTHPTHEYVTRLVLQSCEIFEADPEATDLGETLGLISDYVRSQGSISTIESKEDKPQAGPFIYKDFVWIKLMNLVQRSSIKWGVKISPRALSVRLRRVDMVKEDFGGDFYWGISSKMVKLGKKQDEGV